MGAETFSTLNFSGDTYEGTHFKIVCSGPHDSDGASLNKNSGTTVTITALNGEMISSIKVTMSSIIANDTGTYSDMSYVRVNNKAPSSTSNNKKEATFNGINSTSVVIKLDSSATKNGTWIKPIIVNYTTVDVTGVALKSIHCADHRRGW